MQPKEILRKHNDFCNNYCPLKIYEGSNVPPQCIKAAMLLVFYCGLWIKQFIRGEQISIFLLPMFGGAYPRPLTSFILDQQYKQQAIKKGMKEVCNQFQS